MAKALTGQALISSVSNAAGSTQRSAVLDCTAADGGMLRWRMTNGVTGPTVQCLTRILVARKQASAPASAAEGTGDDAWKVVYEQGGGSANSTSTRGSYRFGPEVAYIHIEMGGNTGQAVTVEATGDTYVA